MEFQELQYLAYFLVVFSFVWAVLGFLFYLIVRRNDIADVMWGLGAVVSGMLVLYVSSAMYSEFSAALTGKNALLVLDMAMVLDAVIVLWGARLVFHIARRLLRSKEDQRYVVWRHDWIKKGKFYFLGRSFFQIYLLQAFLLGLIILPSLLLTSGGGPLKGEILNSIKSFEDISPSFFAVFIFGFLVWLEGFIFESVGDWQLSQFIKKKRSGLVDSEIKVMKKGLWKFTRHPNYWGEIEQWWGIFFMALAFAPNMWWLLIISPLLITFLIVKVSGVPMLEKQMLEKYPHEYREYMNTTNILIPWLPKH